MEVVHILTYNLGYHTPVIAAFRQEPSEDEQVAALERHLREIVFFGLDSEALTERVQASLDNLVMTKFAVYSVAVNENKQ